MASMPPAQSGSGERWCATRSPRAARRTRATKATDCATMPASTASGPAPRTRRSDPPTMAWRVIDGRRHVHEGVGQRRRPRGQRKTRARRVVPQLGEGERHHGGDQRQHLDERHHARAARALAGAQEAAHDQDREGPPAEVGRMRRGRRARQRVEVPGHLPGEPAGGRGGPPGPAAALRGPRGAAGDEHPRQRAEGGGRPGADHAMSGSKASCQAATIPSTASTAGTRTAASAQRGRRRFTPG